MAVDVPAWGWALVGVGAAVLLFVVLSLIFRPRYFSLDGKVVVITGGSSGIGKAAAKVRTTRGASWHTTCCCMMASDTMSLSCYPAPTLCRPHSRRARMSRCWRASRQCWMVRSVAAAWIARLACLRPASTSVAPVFALGVAAAEAAAELQQFKKSPTQRITVHSADVTDEARVAEAIDAVARAHGGIIDVLITSAGISMVRSVSTAANIARVARVRASCMLALIAPF